MFRPPFPKGAPSDARALARMFRRNADGFLSTPSLGDDDHAVAHHFHSVAIALELALKAFLLERGKTDDWNRIHLRHDLAKALVTAEGLGLVVPEGLPALIALLHPHYQQGGFHRSGGPAFPLEYSDCATAMVRAVLRQDGRPRESIARLWGRLKATIVALFVHLAVLLFLSVQLGSVAIRPAQRRAYLEPLDTTIQTAVSATGWPILPRGRPSGGPCDRKHAIPIWYDFNIGGGPIWFVERAIARQSGYGVVGVVAATRGRRSAGIHGRFRPLDAAALVAGDAGLCIVDMTNSFGVAPCYDTRTPVGRSTTEALRVGAGAARFCDKTENRGSKRARVRSTPAIEPSPAIIGSGQALLA